jgi:hypothetical protein
MELPDLYETKDIILKWILSCTTAHQMDLLASIMNQFVLERFEKEVPKWELDMVMTELKMAWMIHKTVIVSNHYEESEIPTLFLHDQNTQQ